VPSLESLKQEGTDEHFFSGDEYVIVPQSASESLATWCQKNAANASLSSRGAAPDDAQEIFYIALCTKTGRNEFKKMTKALVPDLLSAVQTATARLSAKNFLASPANAAFDELSELAAFRNALIRFGAQRHSSSEDDATLIIGGI